MRISLPLLLVWAVLPVPVRAQHDRDHGEHKAATEAKPRTYVYEIHEQQKTVHTGDPQQLKEFIKDLESGKIEGSIEAKKDVNILALKWDLGLWVLVVFLLLLFVLGRFAWKPMLEGLHKREEVIRESVEKAAHTRQEMEELRARFKVEMDEAYAKIPQLMDDARRDAQRMAEEMRAKAAADIQTDRTRMRHELDLAHDQALQDLSTHAAQLATLISAKAIGRSLSEEDHRRLIDEALAEMRHANV